MLKKLDINV